MPEKGLRGHWGPLGGTGGNAGLGVRQALSSDFYSAVAESQRGTSSPSWHRGQSSRGCDRGQRSIKCEPRSTASLGGSALLLTLEERTLPTRSCSVSAGSKAVQSPGKGVRLRSEFVMVEPPLSL